MARILIVEDEPTIAVALQDDLELEGYEVEVVGDGESAAARALDDDHDLILLDLMLPKKDGMTVCREVRDAGIDTPIIVLTAKGQEVDKVLGLELGADDYVTKPFSPRELVARIKAVLRRADATRASGHDTDLPETCEFGDIKVDFAGCRAWRNGDEIGLTALELKLLRAFFAQRGRVLSIDDLIARVWGNVYLSDRVVYTHVNNLRGKIETDPAAPRHVVTVRGMGYRFDE